MAMKPTDQEIGSLYREAGASGPSHEVHRNILTAARAAVEKQPAPAKGWSRWRFPLQATVTVCLVVMVALMVGRREPAAPVIPPLAMNQAGPAAESRAAAPAPETSASSDRMANQAPTRARSEAKVATPASVAAPPATVAPSLAPRPAAPAQPAASRERALTSAPAGNTAAAEMENAAPLAKSESGAAPAAKAAARAAADQAMSPKAWLDSIQVLIDQNQLDEARKRLEAFTRAYPAETVPTAMQARLKATAEGGDAKQP